MRFLADESCSDRDVVSALRAAGHDVRLVAADSAGADDATVVAMALADDRILITKDRDFGQLVFAQGMPTTGVIYVRWPVVRRANLGVRLVDLVADMGPALAGSFVLLRPDRVRIRRRQGP